MPMSGSAIDTNVLIKYLGDDPVAVNLLEDADELFVPMTVVGELLYGVEKSRQKLSNYILYTDFLAQFEQLPVTNETSHCYAEIKASLVVRGINIPENDLWIAAAAVANGLVLLTFDDHFSHIENLELKGR
jgi:predicted nucleic acid-binding protein